MGCEGSLLSNKYLIFDYGAAALISHKDKQTSRCVPWITAFIFFVFTPLKSDLNESGNSFLKTHPCMPIQWVQE